MIRPLAVAFLAAALLARGAEYLTDEAAVLAPRVARLGLRFQF